MVLAIQVEDRNRIIPLETEVLEVEVLVKRDIPTTARAVSSSQKVDILRRIRVALLAWKSLTTWDV
jgi:hypothetical protein